MNTREELLKHLAKNTQVLRSQAIRDAFTRVDRADFIMDDYIVEAYEDYALPIGHEQTISQPTTVAFMLELLELERGHKVLDLGSGSGWTTALLAEMVGENGEVYGVEKIPELVSFGQQNLAKYNYKHASISEAEDGVYGLPAQAPFDRILVSATAREHIPEALLAQLAPEGIMVIPVDDAIVKARKDTKGKRTFESYQGFAFVPLKK